MPVVTLNPTKDTYWYESSQGDLVDYTSHGMEDYLRSGQETHVYSDLICYHDWYALLHFEIFDMLKYAAINSAYLKVYCIDYFKGPQLWPGSTVKMIIRAAKANDWDESAILPISAGASYNRIDYILPSLPSAGTWINVDIKENIETMISEYNRDNKKLHLNFYFTPNYIDPPVAIIMNFASRQHSNSAYWPQLVIDYSNIPPSPPTNLSPMGGISINRAESIRLSWQHNPAIPGEAQKKFEVRWKLQGASTWNIISGTTANQYIDVAGNTFSHGIIEWQVRTYDQRDEVSEWSSIAVFLATDKPELPTISSPANGSTVTGGRLIVQWISDVQTEYELKLLDSSENPLWQEQKVSTDKIKEVGYVLENGKAYKIQLRVKNTDGLWSDYAESNITVQFLSDYPPLVTVATDSARGSIRLDIVNDEARLPKKVRIGLEGRSVINLLPNELSNCENINAFSGNVGSVAVDTNNKVFGSGSINITTAPGAGYGLLVPHNIKDVIDNEKYYCFSIYLKNVNADSTTLRLQDIGAFHLINSDIVTSDSYFVRVWIKTGPNAFSDYTDLYPCVLVLGGDNASENVDGYMLNEITEAEYNDPNYEPPEWVEGNKDVENPVVVSCGKNLFDKNKTIVGYYNYSKGVYINDSLYRTLLIPVKKGVPYTASNTSYRILFDKNMAFVAYIPVETITYTPICDGYYAVNINAEKLDIAQLEEGSIATSYEPYKGQSITVPYTLREYNGIKDEITQDGQFIQRIGYDSATRAYSILTTPIVTQISPIELEYIANGHVWVESEVTPEYTISESLPIGYTNEVFRKLQGETNWTRIAKELAGNASFIDYTPKHKQVYEYKVRTMLQTLAYADSNVSLASVGVNNSQIALPSDYTQWLELKENPKKRYARRFDRIQAKFAGRRFPVSEYSEYEEQDMVLSFELRDENMLNIFDSILGRRQTILFRDSRGRRIFGTVDGYEAEDIIPEGYIVSFTLSRVNYIEGV